MELLAPGGNMVKLKTAFEYGADAVYIGGDVFGLRANADNFTLQEIADAADYADKLHKKIYVTMNIIARNQDLPDMISLPVLPSAVDGDSLDFLLLMPSHSRQEMRVDLTPHTPQLPHITFDYSVPYWSVYRRSVTVWGITFSTGQLSPFAPYPAAKSQDATVLSFPLQAPH